MKKELNHHKTWIEKALEDKSLKHEKKMALLALRVEINNANLIFEQAENYLKYFEKSEKEFGGRWFWREGHETEEDALNSWGFVEWDEEEGLIPGFGSEEEAIENAGKEHGLNREEVVPFKVTRKELKEIRGEE